MKILMYIITVLILSTLSLLADNKIPIYDGSPPISNNYGQAGIPYGVGLHPGIDYNTPIGASIIAISGGTVVYIGEP
jgi:murein DD-endopeptidase MepM/ murein hydrolase activator NlpD